MAVNEMCYQDFSPYGFQDVIKGLQTPTNVPINLEENLREQHAQMVAHPPSVYVLSGSQHVEMPNRFLKSVYLKYPFLIPKGVKKPFDSSANLLQDPELDRFNTLYMKDFRPQEPDIVLARCPEKKPKSIDNVYSRDPETPYMAGQYCKISTEAATRWPHQPPVEAPKIATDVRKIFVTTEYRRNINGTAKLCKRLEAFNTKEEIYLKHQPTL